MVLIYCGDTEESKAGAPKNASSRSDQIYGLEWASSMVASQSKETDNVHILIDLRDLNKALMCPQHPIITVEGVAAQMAAGQPVCGNYQQELLSLRCPRC